MSENALFEKCPGCGNEIAISPSPIKCMYTGNHADNQTIRVEVDAYCEHCDDTYYGHYDLDLNAGDFSWWTFSDYFGG